MRRTGALVACALVGLVGCGDAAERAGGTGDSATLTVYASLPLQGPDGPESEAVVNGARLALREAGGRAGAFVVKLVVLDSATPGAERWTPEQAGENARTAIRDRTTIAYLGDGPSGATAIAIPLLNAGGVPQISPTSGYVGFTRAAGKGEPERYYPSGVRTMARPVPADDVQGRALLDGLGSSGCARLQLLEERDLTARGLADLVERGSQAAGVEVVGRDVVRGKPDVRAEAARVVERRPDCVLYTGALADWVPELFDALHAADPELELLGGDDVASEAFAAALAPGTQRRTLLTAPPGVLEPTPEVRRFVTEYRAAFGVAPRSGALYGHAAMRLALAAVVEAGADGNNRVGVRAALFGLGEQRGPLGPFALTRSGDTSSTRYTQLGVRGGRLVREQTRAYGPAG